MVLSSQHQSAIGFDTLPLELQQEIFSYLDEDDASLFAVVQASKTWYHHCIRMLWRESTQKRLAKVPTSDRRQHYANLILDLDVDDDLSHKSCDELEFPSLKILRFVERSWPVSKLRRYLLAGLHALHYEDCEPDEATLEMLKSCPNQVQAFEIMLPDSSNMSPDHFMSILQSLPALRRLDLLNVNADIMDRVYAWRGDVVAQLEDLSISECWEPVRDLDPRNKFLKHCTGLRKLELDRGDELSADLLVHLFGLASLENLSLYHWIEDDVGRQLQERISDMTSSSRLFPCIKIMSLGGRKPAILPFLSSTLTTLVDLSLQIDDHGDSICPAIGRLTNLVYLRLYFNCDKRLSRTDLDSISGLSKLQLCWIDRCGWGVISETSTSVDCSWITDLYFKSWIAKFPRLETLRLRFDNCALTQASLQYIAKSCPLLSMCHLMWVHDLNTWRSLEAPLFPNLSILLLERVKGESYEKDQAMVDEQVLRDVNMIQDLAPNLSFFRIHSSPPYEKAMMTIFRSRS
ncbi:hypothetical protein KCU64_g10649, partial [Aureobasidium melanogenum]